MSIEENFKKIDSLYDKFDQLKQNKIDKSKELDIISRELETLPSTNHLKSPFDLVSRTNQNDLCKKKCATLISQTSEIEKELTEIPNQIRNTIFLTIDNYYQEIENNKIRKALINKYVLNTAAVSIAGIFTIIFTKKILR